MSLLIRFVIVCHLNHLMSIKFPRVKYRLFCNDCKKEYITSTLSGKSSIQHVCVKAVSAKGNKITRKPDFKYAKERRGCCFGIHDIEKPCQEILEILDSNDTAPPPLVHVGARQTNNNYHNNSQQPPRYTNPITDNRVIYDNFQKSNYVNHRQSLHNGYNTNSSNIYEINQHNPPHSNNNDVSNSNPYVMDHHINNNNNSVNNYHINNNNSDVSIINSPNNTFVSENRYPISNSNANNNNNNNTNNYTIEIINNVNVIEENEQQISNQIGNNIHNIDNSLNPIDFQSRNDNLDEENNNNNNNVISEEDLKDNALFAQECELRESFVALMKENDGSTIYKVLKPLITNWDDDIWTDLFFDIQEKCTTNLSFQKRNGRDHRFGLLWFMYSWIAYKQLGPKSAAKITHKYRSLHAILTPNSRVDNMFELFDQLLCQLI